MNFVPSKADPDVWMRSAKDESCYENIAVYADDLAIATKNPNEITYQLQQKYNFKLKGTGPLMYPLGCAYTRALGTLMGQKIWFQNQKGQTTHGRIRSP